MVVDFERNTETGMFNQTSNLSGYPTPSVGWKINTKIVLTRNKRNVLTFGDNHQLVCHQIIFLRELWVKYSRSREDVRNILN